MLKAPIIADFLTPPEAAKLLRCEPQKIRGFIERGELVASNLAERVGGRPRYRIARHDLESFLLRRQPRRPAKGPTRRKKLVGVTEYF